MAHPCSCANCQRSRDPHWGYMPCMRTARMPPAPPKPPESRVIVESHPIVVVPIVLVVIVALSVVLAVTS